MFDQHTLGLACGTGSIDTITKIMLPDLYLRILCILILQKFLDQKYCTGKLSKQFPFVPLRSPFVVIIKGAPESSKIYRILSSG